MKSDEKQLIILESFDYLKDFWEEKRDSIKKSIVNMFNINKDKAMEMWLSVIINNKKYLKEDSYLLIGDILYDMELTNRYHDENKVREIAIAISAKKDLCKFVYKENRDLGSIEINYITWYMHLRMNETLSQVLTFINENKNLNEYKEGGIISTAISHLDYIDDFNGYLHREIVEIIYNFINKIEDKKEKSEALVSIVPFL